MVNLQAGPNGLGPVVTACLQVAAALVAHTLHSGGVVLQVIAGAALVAHHTSLYPVYQYLVRYIDQQGFIHLDAHIHQRLGLGQVPGEPIQDESIGAVGGGNSVANDLGYDFIRHKFSLVHQVFHLLSQLGAAADHITQRVSGGDLFDPVASAQDIRLGALAGSGRAKHNQFHHDSVSSCRGLFQEALIVAHHHLGFQTAGRIQCYTYHDDDRSTAHGDVHVRHCAQDDGQDGDNRQHQRTG